MENYTGWSCIDCGEEVDGPVNDHECSVVFEEGNTAIWINPLAPQKKEKTLPRQKQEGPRPWRHCGERPQICH